MRFDVLTLFPEMLSGYLGQSILNRAIQSGLVQVRTHDFRAFASGRHAQVDDKPYGGGPGMLLTCEPIFDCVESVQQSGEKPGRLIMMSPQGHTLDQSLVEALAMEERLIILCGRYEGFDERIREGLNPTEISAGDFICNGGEVPAMLLIDTVIRLIPGVLGDETSSRYDTFSNAGLLEYPQYTRPRKFRGMAVPDVLLSGDHQAVAAWRHEQSVKRTAERRADLLDKSQATKKTVQPGSS
ncbi:MAG: tRNA (guanosine(37)-N1)-methyltransferase TrmD [Fuerstiella sp.]|nr:tRNA (guanosine(37)-N1)-methyltransferase TrmD [Fuerstiella sp.]